MSTIALYLAATILMTQRHDDEMATRREQITLELAILSEQKSSKIVALLEEFRRNPNQGDHRIDVEVDCRLDAMIQGGNTDAPRLRGKAATANAQLAYEVYEETRASPRSRSLEAKGGQMQRLLWASTGVTEAGQAVFAQR